MKLVKTYQLNELLVIIIVNSLKRYIKYAIVVLFLLQTTNVFAYEAVTTGESFSTNKDDACKKALDQARESAAQQARVFVSSKYERRIKHLSGEVVEDVTHQTYQSTFGITELEEIIKKQSEYDEKTGSITCKIKAKFDVDTDVVSKELEARIGLEEAKIKEADRRSRLLRTLKYNEKSYTEIKGKARQYDTSIYTASVICKENYSVRDCKSELTEKFEKEKSFEIAQDLNISSKYVSVIFDDFDGDEEHKAMEEYEDAFVITMTGEFNYRVDVSDPYVKENNRIINELALVNGYKTSGNDKEDDVDNNDSETWDESDSVFSNIIFDVALLKGDLLGEDELIGDGESEAYLDALIQLGIIFDVGGAYNENLFRVALYSGDINIRTCLAVDFSGECDSFSTFDTNVLGIGLEKIFVARAVYFNFGGVFFKTEDKDIIGTDFFQIKVGISNKGPGPYMYADIYSILPTSSTEKIDIEPSIDITIGVGVRF